MSSPKRFQPPISALRALESFERTGNVTQTGESLGLSQSAVSRQLKVLEEYLDTSLFVRERKSITLTPAAREYARDIRRALDEISTASLRLKANPGGGQLNLAILPAFGVRWLAPKLPEFVAKHPEVTVNLSTRLKPFEFARESFHAAIHFGQMDWPDVHYQHLMEETVIPVASPERAKMINVEDENWPTQTSFLHLDTRPNAWELWAAAQGIKNAPRHGMLFDQFASMIQAATHGLGTALIPSYLIQDELEAGALVPISNLPLISIGSYYLVWPQSTSDHGPKQHFSTWLASIENN